MFTFRVDATKVSTVADFVLFVQNIPKNPDIFTFFNASVKSSRNLDLAISFNLNTTYYKHVKHKKKIPGAVRSPGNLIFSNGNQKHYEEKKGLKFT